ncbi:conserved hypothetical protein [Burkholderia sp. 8Y]|uniref:hypothetical protein n=1 Tax=Burkholderia sp. 8Y TaxID=2653133 RepID=UPI0012F356CC|nr:hypothetical protein [Burkholderia sp. 8Y]VXC14410.1 conserved hypothetical protein [Burkholderia sp. 8Y]
MSARTKQLRRHWTQIVLLALYMTDPIRYAADTRLIAEYSGTTQPRTSPGTDRAV